MILVGSPGHLLLPGADGLLELCLREIGLVRLFSLLGSHSSIVKLLQGWQSFYDEQSVEGVLGNGVVPEPENLKIWAESQVLDLEQGGNKVFPQVQFRQSLALGEILQGRYFVQGEGSDLDLGHIRDHGDVFQVVAPQVQVLYRV